MQVSRKEEVKTTNSKSVPIKSDLYKPAWQDNPVLPDPNYLIVPTLEEQVKEAQIREIERMIKEGNISIIGGADILRELRKRD